MIELRTYFDCGDNEYLCYRCGCGTTVLWVLVEDGNTDDEQYVCTQCAEAVAGGDALGRLRFEAPKPS